LPRLKRGSPVITPSCISIPPLGTLLKEHHHTNEDEE